MLSAIINLRQHTIAQSGVNQDLIARRKKAMRRRSRFDEPRG